MRTPMCVHMGESLVLERQVFCFNEKNSLTATWGFNHKSELGLFSLFLGHKQILLCTAFMLKLFLRDKRTREVKFLSPCYVWGIKNK